MPNRFIESHIRQIPRFAQMPESQFHHVAQGFQVQRFEPGERIFRQGEPSRGLYMFVTGRGRLLQADEHGHESNIGIVNTNQYLNENALYNPGIETASLEVTETATVLHLSRQTLLDIVTHQPEVKTWLPVSIVDTANRRTHTRLFEAQRENETVLMDTRRHWWVWVRRTWLSAFFVIVMVVISSLLPPELAIAIDGLSLILAGLWVMYAYLEWRNDHVIITNQRIIRIERTIPRFETHVSEVPLSAIQAVNADLVTSDPFSRVFDYGTVEIRTAGQGGNIKLTIIPHPDAVQELIFLNRNAALAQRESQQQSHIRAEIDKVLGIHNPEATVHARAAQDQRQPPERPETFIERGTIWPTAFMDDDGNSVFRKHVAFLFRRMAMPLMLVLASPLLIILSFTVLDEYSGAGMLVALAFLVVGIPWIYWVDWDWRHDRYVVTDERIQLIHQRPLWLQNEDDIALLQSVDNVVSRKNGLLQNLLDYGDVVISLLGADRSDQKVFHSVPRPQEVQAEITRRQNRMRAKAAEQEERQRREEIGEYLQAYHQTVAGQQYPGQTYAPAGGTPNPVPSQQAPPYPEPDEYPQSPQRRPPPVQPPSPPDTEPRPPSRRPGGQRPPNVPRRRGE